MLFKLTGMGRHTHAARADLSRITVVLSCLLLASCAAVPVFDETLGGTHSQAEIEITGALERHMAIEQAVAESPLFAGNEVSILRDGAQTFPAMFAAIHAAKHYLYLEYYIFEDLSCNGEQLERLLKAKAQEGVRVYLIYDGIGSLWTPTDFFTRLQNAGIQVVQFNPPKPLHAGGHFSLNDRDHRKMLIADGTVVVNLSSTYQSGPGGSQLPAPQDVWHDTDLEISGPVVIQLEKLSQEHGREQGGADLALEDDSSPTRCGWQRGSPNHRQYAQAPEVTLLRDCRRSATPKKLGNGIEVCDP